MVLARKIYQRSGFLSHSYENVVFSGDAEIVTPLFIWYEECRSPRQGSPAADQ
jgi:hypothetical protein